MNIGQRPRELRTARRLSQGDLEGRTGLLRCYTSRVEHGHTIPSVETIEKYTTALGVSLATFFSEDVAPFKAEPAADAVEWGPTRRERLASHKLNAALAALEREDRQFLVALAQRLGKKTG